MTSPAQRITVIGGGLIGASWCALFLAHGHHVTLHDVAPDVEARVRAELRRIAPVLQALGLRLDADTALLRVQPDLAAAVRDAQWVQECGPERIVFKRALWAQVEAHCPARTVLMSSSSGIPASLQARGMRTPERLLIAHPFNPPHLIPLVELVPGPRTAAWAMDQAHALHTSLGKRVVRLHKEIPGFVANRIQAAVIRESVSLVRQGVVSAADLDAAVTQSLGLRWAVGGPMLSAHLGGGPGGIRAFWQQFADGLQLLWLHMRLRPVWLSARSREALAREVEDTYGAHDVATWSTLRDQQQLAVLRALGSVPSPQDDEVTHGAS